MPGYLRTEEDRAHTAAMAPWRDVEQAEPELSPGRRNEGFA